MINTAHDFDQLTSKEQARLFDAWNAQTICRLLTTASADSAIRRMADAAGWEGMTPPAHPDGWEWDAEHRDYINPNPPAEPLPSIWDRVRAIVGQFPKSAQVKFPFEKYDYYKRAGDVEGARLVIEGYDTSGESSDIQHAQQAILAEFDK